MVARFGMVVPIAVTPAILTATDIALDDTYSAWSGATTYVTGDIVYVAATRLRYKAVQGSTGQDPTTDTTATYWSAYGAITRYRPFDVVLARYASATTSFYYEFVPTTYTDAVALFNLVATSVRLQIWNTTPTEIYDVTTSLVDKSDIRDFPSFLTWTPVYASTFLKLGLPVYAGYTLRITIAGASGDDVRVGEIVLGRAILLGISQATGTEIGTEDYSTVETNEQGEREVVERDYADTAEYAVLVENNDQERVRRLIAARRTQPTVYFTGEDHRKFGTLVFGIASRPRFPVSAAGYVEARIPVTGVS